MNLPAPYYQDEAVQIFHADCREMLPLLEPGSIEITITSPPYNVDLAYESWDEPVAYLCRQGR